MIHILGWYEHENIGDEAYKIAFPKLFKNYEFTFGEKIQGKPDTIILGGGDILSPKFFKILDQHPQAKKYAFSINLRAEDIGPNLARFNHIISRNFVDLRTTDAYKIQCYPDFTFILEPNKDHGKQLIKDLFNKYKSELYENVVVLTLNSFLCVREKILARDYVAFDKICYDLSKLMDNTNASFILVPFGNGFPQNDRISNAFVYANAKFWRKNLLLFEKLTIQQTLDIFAAADAAVTTRLHSAIFSCIGGIPFVDITHHTKNQMFMDFIGKPEWSLDFWHLDYFKALNLLKDFMENKEFFKNQVSKINISAKKLLNQIIDIKL
jgi:polysaccharide pyruvyl transferase WcaK-like protein